MRRRYRNPVTFRHNQRPPEPRSKRPAGRSSTGRECVLRRLLRRVLTILWREDRTRSLGDLPDSLSEHTCRQFGQHPGQVRDVFRDEERRFGGLLTRGRKVLEQFEPGRTLGEHELAYLHETHGLPPDLVIDLLAR